MRYPALAVLEFGSVAAGLRAADLMLKGAPIALFKAGTVHPGRFLVLLGGTVASVEEAFRQGCAASPAFLHDTTLLPDVHPEVYAAVMGECRDAVDDALGVVESRGVASIVRAADAAVKGASVRILALRMADDLGGNSFFLLDGCLADVQAGISLAVQRAGRELLFSTAIPRPDLTLRQALGEGTVFRTCSLLQPEGAEGVAG